MVLVLAFSFILLVVLLYRGNGCDMREAGVKSYVLLFLFIAVSTEILSYFNSITNHVILCVWIFVLVVLVSVVFIVSKLQRSPLSFRGLLPSLGAYQCSERCLLIVLAIVMLITLSVAVVSPPNNWDSLTYHMARVAEWIEHQNISFYPTSITRQNYQMPLAEFAILHLQLLAETDRFANMVQWISFWVSIALVTLIAKELGGSFRTQLISAVIGATIPMAILQSSSTQNDLVTSAFCLSFAYFFLKFIKKANMGDVLFSSASLGLALLTKGTSFIYCSAIGVALTAAYLFQSGTEKKRLTKMGILVFTAALGVVISLPHLSRNYVLYGNFLSNETSLYNNHELSVSGLMSNIIRNGALHLGTPSRQANHITYDLVETILGEELNNPKTTFMDSEFIIPFARHEDDAGNLPHFLLICFAIPFLAVTHLSEKRTVCWYAATIVMAALLYCVVLKWQPWASRLHTPLFMLAAPLIALVMSGLRWLSWKRQLFTVLLLFLYSIPFLVLNASRPLIPFRGYSVLRQNGNEIFRSYSVLTQSRIELYFVNNPKIYPDYSDAVKIMAKERPDEVGLFLDGNDLEYLLWVLAGKNAVKRPPRFRHVGVLNISKTLERAASMPAYVLATKENGSDVIESIKYKTVFESENIRVLKMDEGR